MVEAFLDVGTTVSIQKTELDDLLAVIKSMGYEIVGPKAKDHAIIHGIIGSAYELPIGYNSQQSPGKYKLINSGHNNYFEVTNGPHSWKQYFFPPKSEMMRFDKKNGNKPWEIDVGEKTPPRYAMLGVRPCDLVAIEIQDKVFMREEWCDPIYRDRRSNALIIAVNCMEPSSTCFCTSMGTGPEARGGFDLCLTELENTFLVEIGSEAGRMAMSHESISWQPASAFMLQSARKGLQAARQKISRELPDPEKLQQQLLTNLDHPRWDDVADRCMSCTSCTQVCPTCFCWDTYDSTLLPGDTILRKREWDSCFNPDYSYVFGGNTRPNTHSRYRQWLTHKWASWYDQFGTSGCVGCGRCITWCPAEIDHLEEIASIRGETLREGRTVMTISVNPISGINCESHPMLPNWAELVDIQLEAPGVSTYWLRFLDPEFQRAYTFKPGQFNILTVPGYGEAAISISSDVENKEGIGHTIRLAGDVTNAIARLEVGSTVGVRGPFGSSWPIEACKGKDIFIAAGGIGLPPLRPVIYHIMKNRAEFGEVVVLYGARTPNDLQFRNEFEVWRRADVDVMITVDRATEDWEGTVGVVPLLFYRLRMNPQNSVAFTCGPEIMMRYVVYEALARRLSEHNIYVSFERNMKCGFGSCGHCQLGPYFVCKDGPVFSYQQLQPYFNVEDF